jgi:tetratricopeptide (TPR) repeat protein
VSQDSRLSELARLGDQHRRAGNAAAAEPLLREALAIAEADFPHDGPKVASALNSLGLLCKDLARYDEARALYERALAIVERAEPSEVNSQEIACLYHNLGGIEHARCNYAQGEVFARKGIEIRKRLGTRDETSLAADMVALAAILDGQQKFDEAEPLYIEALGILERSPQRNAEEIAVALNDLGALYAQRGLSDRAEHLLTRAVDLKRQTIGEHHPDVAVTLNNLAIVHKRRGEFERAVSLYRNALGIFEEALGSEHPKTLACRRNYERCAADAAERRA